MNKKIKMIELLNMITNGELKNNTKFNIINEDGDIIKCKYSSTYPGYIWVIDNEEVSFNYKIDHLRILSYEVEILEDNTEEIEELEIDENGFIHTNIGAWQGRKLDVAFADKINELVKAVNKLRKESEDEQ